MYILVCFWVRPYTVAIRFDIFDTYRSLQSFFDYRTIATQEMRVFLHIFCRGRGGKKKLQVFFYKFKLNSHGVSWLDPCRVLVI